MGRLVGFLITSARLSLFDLSVLILKSIYTPVVEFHEGPYNGLFGFLSYGVYVFLKVLVWRDIRPRMSPSLGDCSAD